MADDSLCALFSAGGIVLFQVTAADVLAGYREVIPDSRRRIAEALKIMTYGYRSSELHWYTEELFCALV